MNLLAIHSVFYHLHGQTGWSTVWANGTQKFGLEKFIPESSNFNKFETVIRFIKLILSWGLLMVKMHLDFQLANKHPVKII